MVGSWIQWILGALLVLSSLGVILLRRPVHASLCFLFTLLTLAVYYLQLSAPFIAIIQILIYAGAILVIFMFVIILFQNAHEQLNHTPSQSNPLLIGIALTAFLSVFFLLAHKLWDFSHHFKAPPNDFGTVKAIGESLYIDFFFPFEAMVVLFLVALLGVVYIGKRER
jgi:NADH-quinone oxidoreductase subunit J